MSQLEQRINVCTCVCVLALNLVTVAFKTTRYGNDFGPTSAKSSHYHSGPVVFKLCSNVITEEAVWMTRRWIVIRGVVHDADFLALELVMKVERLHSVSVRGSRIGCWGWCRPLHLVGQKRTSTIQWDSLEKTVRRFSGGKNSQSRSWNLHWPECYKCLLLDFREIKSPP